MERDEVVSKRNDELNMLLVLVSSSRFCKPACTDPGAQVGLLAATITAFIIYLQPQLKEDSGDTSAALLLALLYNANSTLVGGNPPPIPNWQGAPVILTAAQIILYACLAGTLLCGWFALVYKFFTDSYALGWKNKLLDTVTHFIFILLYFVLAGVFFGIFVALTLQVPFLPSAALKALTKVHK